MTAEIQYASRTGGSQRLCCGSSTFEVRCHAPYWPPLESSCDLRWQNESAEPEELSRWTMHIVVYADVLTLNGLDCQVGRTSDYATRFVLHP